VGPTPPPPPKKRKEKVDNNGDKETEKFLVVNK
jgi:hypothetical protein